jgi:hypothetical protein
LFDYLLWSQMQLTILLVLLAVALKVGEPRATSVFDQRLEWDKFMEKHGKRDFFKRHLRMRPKSFKKLISFIKDDIQPNERMAEMRGGAIIPEIRLYCTIRWLAGGSYSDIMIHSGWNLQGFLLQNLVANGQGHRNKQSQGTADQLPSNRRRMC